MNQSGRSLQLLSWLGRAKSTGNWTDAAFIALRSFAGRVHSAMTRLHVWRGNSPGHSAKLHKLRQLRYQIYVEELKKQLPNADHKTRTLPDADDSTGWHFLVTSWFGRALGCVLVHYGSDVPEQALTAMRLTASQQLEPGRFGYISKLMLQPSMRGRGTGLVLFKAMVAFARQQTQQRVDHALFHCNPRLVPMYERVGFRRFGLPFVDPHVGLQVPMVYLINDRAYLEAIKSPLAELAHGTRADATRIEALYRIFNLGTSS